MKTLTIIAIAALIALSPSHARADDKNQVGRFQIVSAGPEDIFKIDTLTGETWQYFSGTDKNGKFRRGWSPVFTPEEEADKISKELKGEH
jgi:hypothetical protein